MTAPTPDPADVELVARALATHRCDSDIFDKFTGSHWDTQRDLYRDDARAVLAALAEAGQLSPPDADTRTQWAVRKSSVPDGEGVGLPSSSREKAEFDRDRWLSRDRGYPVTAELVQREVRNWPDGSCWIGPWVPVPTTEES